MKGRDSREAGTRISRCLSLEAHVGVGTSHIVMPIVSFRESVGNDISLYPFSKHFLPREGEGGDGMVKSSCGA